MRGQTDQNRGGRKADRTVADASVDPSGKKRNTGADVNQHIRGRMGGWGEGGVEVRPSMQITLLAGAECVLSM